MQHCNVVMQKLSNLSISKGTDFSFMSVDLSVLYVFATICLSVFMVGITLYWIIVRHTQLKGGPPGSFGSVFRNQHYCPIVSSRPAVGPKLIRYSVGYPILGSIFFAKWTRKGIQKEFTWFRQKYGAVYRLYIGTQFAVVINDFASMVLAIREHERNLLRRFDHPTINIIHREGMYYSPNKKLRWKGFLYSSGTHWEIVSLFTRTALFHCQQNAIFISKIASGATQLSDNVSGRFNQQLPSLRLALHKNISETMAALLIGKEFAQDRAKMNRLTDVLTFISSSVATGSYGGQCPFRKRFTEKRTYFEKTLHAVNKDLHDEISMQYTTRNLSEGTFSELYLDHMGSIRRFRGETVEKLVFTENELVSLLLELVAGGTAPLVEIMYDGLGLLARHPHVQVKVQTELDQFALGKRSPYATHPLDYDKLPYLTGTCCEILRLATVTKFGACRLTTDAFHLRQHKIAAGSLLIANIYAVHRDPTVWRLPEVFLPERYFSSDGSFRVPPSLVPYSIGERACPGGYLATHMLIAYISGLLRRSTVVLGHNSTIKNDRPYYDFRFIARPNYPATAPAMDIDERSIASVSL